MKNSVKMLHHSDIIQTFSQGKKISVYRNAGGYLFHETFPYQKYHRIHNKKYEQVQYYCTYVVKHVKLE
jgi:hypothetical protein